MTDKIKNKPVELKPEHLDKMFGSGASSWYQHLKPGVDSRQINTTYRLAGFLATIGVESGNLRQTEENLNYSAERLMQIFPSKFPSRDKADKYAKNSRAIANYVYANKNGNGDEASEDGWKYRGRGLIQLTGKINYQQYQRTGKPALSNPDALAQKELAADSATWFWQTKAVNGFADRSDVEGMRRRVNGGLNGIEEFRSLYNKALLILSEQDPEKEIVSDPESSESVTEAPDQPETWDPVPKAKNSKIVEPIPPGKSQYPWNKVFESRSGHVMEIDDTPDRERLHWYHRTGTYTEMHPNGDHITKSVRERHDYCVADRYHQTGGNYTSKVGGSTFYKVGSDTVLSMGGKYSIEAPGNVSVTTPQANFSELVVCKDFRSQTADVKQIHQRSGIANLKARASLHADRASRLGGPPPSPSFGMANASGGPFVPPSKPSDGSTVGFFGKGDVDLIVQPERNAEYLIPGNKNEQVGGDNVIACGGKLTLYGKGGVSIGGGLALDPTSAGDIPSSGVFLFYDSASSKLSLKVNGAVRVVEGSSGGNTNPGGG